MRRPMKTSLLRLAIIGVLSAAAAQAAVAAGTASQVQELFETAWKPSSEGFATAHQLFDQAKAAAPTDMRVPLAMSLISVRNYKNDEAAKYDDQALATSSASSKTAKKLDPIDLAARRLKIYLQVLRKDHAGAQASMHELAGIIGTDDSIAPSEGARKTAEWLGGVVGFYAGPMSGTSSSPNARALQDDLGKQMKGVLANTMAEGKAASLKQFEQLQAQQAKARDDIKNKLASKRADDLKKAQTAQSAVAEKLSKINATKDNPDAKSKKNEAAEKQVQNLQMQQNRLQQQLAMEMQKPRRNDQAILRLNAELTLLGQRIQQAQNGPGENEAQREAAQKAAAEAEKKKLESQSATLEAKTKQLSSGSDDVISTPVDAKLVFLGNYAPIDWEKEKQRILDSYPAK